MAAIMLLQFYAIFHSFSSVFSIDFYTFILLLDLSFNVFNLKKSYMEYFTVLKQK